MGDLYSTACAVLCLEVYYRYNPSHQHETDIQLHRPKDSKSNMPAGKPVTINGEILDLAISGHRAKYLRLKTKEDGLGALPLLMSHLEDEVLSVRSTALYEIGKLKATEASITVGNMLSSAGQHRHTNNCTVHAWPDWRQNAVAQDYQAAKFKRSIGCSGCSLLTWQAVWWQRLRNQ